MYISVDHSQTYLKFRRSIDLIELMRGVSEGSGDRAAIPIGVNEGGPFDAIMALPADREGGIRFFDVDRFGLAITGEPRGELIGRVEQLGIAGFGGEQDQLTDGDDALIVTGCPTLNVAHLFGETKAFAVEEALARSTLDCCATHVESHGCCHGHVHQAVRQSAGVCLPLLRPHCHSRLSQRPVTA